MQPVSDDLLETSRRLIKLGARTLSQDVALARSPIWHLVSRTLSTDDLVNPTGPLVRVAGPSLTIGDQRVFAELFTHWARMGFPSDHRVSFTIPGLAKALGLQHKGGRQYELVRSSLRRLTSAVFADVQPDGRFESETGGALIAAYQTRSRPGVSSSAALNERTVRTLLRHPMTYLDAPTWDALMARDLLAARMWVWLEGERVGGEWRWSLFPNGGEPVVLGLHPPARRTTPVAQLLTLNNWSRRRRVVERIRAAAQVVVEIDQRYELEVRPSVTDKGNYVLVCRRTAKTSSRDPDAGADVEAAWHAVSPRRRLSRRQLTILRDLITEWGAARIVEALAACAGAPDPFAEVLRSADAWRESCQSEWQQTKLEEDAHAPETLRIIQRRLAAGATAGVASGRDSRGPSPIRDVLADLG